MKISIEKKPINNEENYFVLRNGEKEVSVSVNAVKAIALIWVFMMTAVFTLIIGQQTSAQNSMVCAYLAKGNLTNEKGEPVDCNPVMNEKRELNWNCTTKHQGVAAG